MPPTPEPGQVVRVRSRQYLVDEVVAPPKAGDNTLVRLSCLNDDAQGERLEVLWESEVDAQVLGGDAWADVAKKGFDPPALFAAYLHTLDWNQVTSTDPKLMQAPFRAGIEVMAYQLEPLRKALLLPRVNLFIADDVGLGKTIEAGLIVRELLIRQKVRRIVVACPASVLLQWRDEMEARFGLTFEVLDRDYVIARRRERGYGVNPWSTHSRFIVSQSLLRDEAYAAPLRDWLGGFSPGSLLILDEAHHAAPASGSKYAIDSYFTQVIRDLAPRFEHRLFLSATPHNGYPNSFAALLELLDPNRFCRGVPVKSHKLLEAVMVRRLKSDIREVAGGFPLRRVIQIDIDGLPQDATELRLADLLASYTELRTDRLRESRKTIQAAAALVTTSLQKRLLSSVEAFARTLRVHRASAEKALKEDERQRAERELPFLSGMLATPGPDDERGEEPEQELEGDDDGAIQAATRIVASASVPNEERKLLDEMASIAEAARGLADPRVQKLVDWIRANMCPGLPSLGSAARTSPLPAWNDRRLLIFTEYTDTKRYLEQQLQAALAGTDRGDDRVATLHGGLSEERREDIKAAFNAGPSRNPLRILIATDAAREGINLQNHCADLFHFDVPWNPGRMEQRNGRIDRKLQRSPEVRCHYFFFAQREEDRVLQTLVRKTEVIEKELGSLSPVLEGRLAKLLESGIRREDVRRLAREIENIDASAVERAVVAEELDGARERKEDLARSLERLRDSAEASRRALGLSEEALRNTMSASLQLLGADPLKPLPAVPGLPERFTFPALDRQDGADPTWADTLDTLRPRRGKDQRLWEWRRDSAPRPVVFRDPGFLDESIVQLHLEHRVVRRLLGRFVSQGFVYEDLSRATALLADDAIPRVVLLGRLSLYGAGAARLHDEILVAAARWSDPATRKGRLSLYAETGMARTLEALEKAIETPDASQVPEVVQQRLLSSVQRDVSDLLPLLSIGAQRTKKTVLELLLRRGNLESFELKKLLEEQRDRITKAMKKLEDPQLILQFEDEADRRQMEADRRHQQKRLAAIEEELKREPARVEAAYEVKATRLETVGLVYLWPRSG